MTNIIRIGSRGSDLALWQANFFKDQLENAGVQAEIVIIKTKGDRIQDLSFDKIEGKGFFTKEIEAALLNKEVDVAIHSHKDLETTSTEGLVIAGVSYREDPSELLLIHPDAIDLTLPLHFKQGAVIGTSSARRKSQVKALRPDIEIKDIRGNVPTRVNKLRSGDYDAILLANAGIRRLKLDLSDLRSEKLDPRYFIPAPAQGVLAYQCRSNDAGTITLIQSMHHHDVANAIAIERGILSGFGGGCHIPIGIYAQASDTGFTTWVTYGSTWESFPMRTRFSCSDAADALKKFSFLKTHGLPQSIFISSETQPGSYLERAARHFKSTLLGKSLISTRPMAFQAVPDKSLWVVFSSSRGVEAFFAQENPYDWKHIPFAAAGESTAKTLARYGIKASFIGSESNMDTVANDLAKAIGHAGVLMPSSNRSLQSLAKYLDPAKVHRIDCYETILNPQPLQAFDAYIFTSPSNVEAFFSAGNALKPGARVIAIGNTTASALEAHHDGVVVAHITHEVELFGLLAG